MVDWSCLLWSDINHHRLLHLFCFLYRLYTNRLLTETNEASQNGRSSSIAHTARCGIMALWLFWLVWTYCQTWRADLNAIWFLQITICRQLFRMEWHIDVFMSENHFPHAFKESIIINGIGKFRGSCNSTFLSLHYEWAENGSGFPIFNTHKEKHQICPCYSGCTNKTHVVCTLPNYQFQSFPRFLQAVRAPSCSAMD